MTRGGHSQARADGAGRRERRTEIPGLGIPPFLFLLFALVLPTALEAQPLSGAIAGALEPGLPQARSHSGQFIIHTLPGRSPAAAVSSMETNRSFVRLDTTLLPISAERIKSILYRELGAAGTWDGKIFLTLYPARSEEDQITIDSGHFLDGWQYRVLLPNLIERSRYVEAMTQVVLLEMANRQAREHSAEIPPWLTQGFCQQLLAGNAMEIILSPPGKNPGGLPLTTNFVNGVRTDPLKQAHEKLSSSALLTFQQLSWPTDNLIDAEKRDIYRCNAQLFVNGLLRLKSGRACLRTMITKLPQYYNWQFAFLDAFREYFQRPLDIEKWWELRLVHFTGRGLEQTWGVDESWQKLDEVVRSAVQVRTGTNELPLRAETKLQTIIREWEPVPQTQTLRLKAFELAGLRLRLAQQFVPLADEYQHSLESYLAARDRPAGFLAFGRKAGRRHATETALRQLDDLDARLQEMRPAAKPSAVQAEMRPLPGF